MASPGQQAATRTDPGRRNQQGGGKTTASNGGAASTGALTQAAGPEQKASAQVQVNRQYGTNQEQKERAARSWGNPTQGGTQMGPEGPANPSASATATTATTTTPARPPAQFAPNGRPLTDGTIQTYDDPSLGQVLSALGRMPVSPFGVVSTLASVADSDQYGRDLFGRTIDEENGATPDPGYQGPNHIASNTNARGDRPSDDTRLMDRASAAARDALGDTSDGASAVGDDGGAEFSSVRLSDRRRPYDDVSAVDLLRGLL